ncbi:Fusaric acid resistance protein-like/Protein of unknown function (DUF2955) [Spongiibacter sp. IMCC21906]|uniref:FUSC family protein n=1 Tax=Spongiibacter sp. IMCC21906 TaxID=1620392 RepID=UPI00062DCCBB|nr:FUSC family protein [Spongiibacter sp. IMCC21906]AKH69273.1 Fusaric acid resistance protein-like/Protein of unknown function (DUF2955) [Spongiibacter sp. IMCC21906]
MYVAPRPRVEDDPLFAVRLASAATLGFIIAVVLQSPMPMLIPALAVGMMAGMRKRFAPQKAFGGPLVMIVMIVVFSGLVSLTRPMPAVLISIIGMLYVLAYYLILKTGNPIGMLILIVTVLMSIMGMNSLMAMEVMRDAFIEGSLVALVTTPLLYLLMPPVSTEKMIEVHPPAPGEHIMLQALIRGAVLLLQTFWLYTVVDETSVMLAMAAVFVLVFPSREQLFAEAKERTFATVLGGGMALLIVALFSLMAHFAILLLLIFLGGLFFASRMMNGRHPSMVYQFAFSVMIALTIGGLSSQSPFESAIVRIALTLAGAITAAFLTSLLESLIIGRQLRQPQTKA